MWAWRSKFAHDLLIETVYPARARKRDQRHFAALARFEAHGGAGGDVQAQTAGGTDAKAIYVANTIKAAGYKARLPLPAPHHSLYLPPSSVLTHTQPSLANLP